MHLLTHDLGHSPFGHEGERVLNDLMADHGGFDHNLQSLRCVEVLESLPTFAGLNLSWKYERVCKHEANPQVPPRWGFDWPLSVSKRKSLTLRMI